MPCLHGKLAKLGGVVPYGYIHPRTNRLTVPVKLTRGKSRKKTSALLNRDQCMYTHVGHARDHKYSIFKKKCGAGWRDALRRHLS